MGLRSLLTHCSQEESWGGEGVGEGLPEGHRDCQQEKRTFTTAAQEAWVCPTLQILQPQEGKMEAQHRVNLLFATSLTPSRNVFLLHLCIAVWTAALLWHVLPMSATLVQYTICSAAHPDWFCASTPHSSTVAVPKASRSLTSPTLNYLCPLQPWFGRGGRGLAFFWSTGS